MGNIFDLLFFFGFYSKELEHLIGNVYKIGGQYPVFGICFVIQPNENITAISSDILKMIDYFCDNSMPHNLLWTIAPYGERPVIKIFIYPRCRMSDKTHSGFNVAFCELSGYVPIGGRHITQFQRHAHNMQHSVERDSGPKLKIINWKIALIPFTDSEVFETLTGNMLNSEIRKAMGSIDDKHLISEIIRLYSE